MAYFNSQTTQWKYRFMASLVRKVLLTSVVELVWENVTRHIGRTLVFFILSIKELEQTDQEYPTDVVNSERFFQVLF